MTEKIFIIMKVKNQMPQIVQGVFSEKNLSILKKQSREKQQNPTEEEIKHYLTGNLCRCTGYMGQLRAIKTYMGVK